MPRQRAINPEFWVDDKLSQLSPLARLFYIGTWNFADDYGVIENNPVKLKILIFPYDSIDVTPLIAELVTSRRLLPYHSEGKNWFYIANFTKWQSVEKPSKWKNPPPPENIKDLDTLPNHYPTTTLPVGTEEKRREEKDLSQSEIARASNSEKPKPTPKGEKQPSTEKNETQLLMQAFYDKLNPGLNFANTTERNACKWIIKHEGGLEQALALVDYLASIKGLPYAPVITTPYKLKIKYGDLEAYDAKMKTQ